MSPSTDSTPPGSAPPGQPVAALFDERPDDVFALVAGLALALVIAPLVTAVAIRVLADLALSYIVLLGTGASVTTGGALVVRRVRGLPERIGRSRRHWLLALAGPALVGIAGLALLVAGEFSAADGVLGVVAVGGGLAGGGVLSFMAHSRYVKAVTAESEHFATWRAGWSERRKQPLTAFAAVAVVGGVLAIAVAILIRIDLLRLVGQFVIPLAAVAYAATQPRTYTATAAGLQAELPAARKLHEWNRFEGYVLDDDAIVLHYRAAWRLPVICAREELDDEEAVVAALDRALPRLPSLSP